MKENHRSNGHKKGRVRKRTTLSMQAFRSALTTGSSLFSDKRLDQRSAMARRFRDLIQAHEAQLANDVSEAEQRLIRRAAMLTLQLEMMDSKFAANDGEATLAQLQTYQTVSNTLRRLLESLGLRRRARDITPRLSEYIQQEAAE